MDDIVTTTKKTPVEAPVRTVAPTCAFNPRGVSAEVCKMLTAVWQKNMRCTAMKCPSKIRACQACVRQGGDPEPVSDRERGLCAFHEKHGESVQISRPGEAYGERRISRSICISGKGKGGEEVTKDAGVKPVESAPTSQRGKRVVHRGTTTIRRLPPGTLVSAETSRAPVVQPTHSFEPERVVPPIHTPQPILAPVAQAPPVPPPEPKPTPEEEPIKPPIVVSEAVVEDVAPSQPLEAEVSAKLTGEDVLTAEEVVLKQEVTTPVWRLYRQGRINRTALQRIARYDKTLQYALARDVANGIKLASKL